MKKVILAMTILFSFAAYAEEPKQLEGRLAQTLYDAMGPDWTPVAGSVKEKSKFVTCLIMDHEGRKLTLCQTLGSSNKIFGPGAEYLYSLLPKRSQGHDGQGGIYRGVRITCRATETASASTAYNCVIPQ